MHIFYMNKRYNTLVHTWFQNKTILTRRLSLVFSKQMRVFHSKVSCVFFVKIVFPYQQFLYCKFMWCKAQEFWYIHIWCFVQLATIHPWSDTPLWVFLNCTNGTKLRKISHILLLEKATLSFMIFLYHEDIWLSAICLVTDYRQITSN